MESRSISVHTLLRSGLIAITAAGIVTAGCGDEIKTEEGAGPPTGGGNLANARIDASNAGSVYTAANSVISNAIAAVFRQAARKPVASPALAKSISVTVSGRASGKVTTSGEFNPGRSEVTMRIRLTFQNFSDDNQLFVGGPLDIDYTVAATDPAGLKFSYKGTLSFSGLYKGAMGFDIAVAAGKATGSYSVGEQAVNL